MSSTSPTPWNVAEFIRTSPWAYPSLEVVHLVGLGLVFGTLRLVELRLLGIGRRLDVGALLTLRAEAHHGWTSFDESKPLYFEGEIVAVRWRNPHAEIDLRIEAGLERPADPSTRSVPAQQAAVDAARILADAQPPPRPGVWTCELAPLTRLAAWQAPQPGVSDRAYPLRSAPA